MNTPDFMAKNMPKKKKNCGNEALKLRNKKKNCDCGIVVAEQHFLKSCGIAIAEVLPLSCGIAVADSKKVARAHLCLYVLYILIPPMQRG